MKSINLVGQLTILRRIWRGSPTQPWYDIRQGILHDWSPRRSQIHQVLL